MTGINYMDPAEFRDSGLLHEVNRLLLHPIGCALQLNPETGEIRVWDYRDDPEGIYFDESTLDPEKAAHVRQLWLTAGAARTKRLGYLVQPVDRPCLTTSPFYAAS
jgi:hypothetical protein